MDQQLRTLIYISKEFLPQKKYVIDVFFSDFLNVEYTLEVSESITSYVIRLDQNEVTIPDVFFGQNLYEHSIEPSVSNFKTSIDDPCLSELPGWFSGEVSETGNDSEALPVDIFGMAFFLLTGYSDIHFSKKDAHQRDLGKSSFLVKRGIIDRPIIQEWFTVLAKKLYPNLNKKGCALIPYSKHVSHDVDQPFEYLDYTIKRLFKRLVGDITVRRSLPLAINRFKTYYKVKSGDTESDPYNNFTELIEVLKENDTQSIFFFVAGGSHPNFDVLYDINHSAIKKIISLIHASKHKIGLHPSYKTLGDTALMKQEFKMLQQVLESIDINEPIDSCRKHYLRWDWECTPDILEEVGIKNDYTVGYADRTGFRTGVAFPYQAYSWKNQTSLNLYIHPLVVMECSLTATGYMELSWEEAEEKILSYHELLNRIGGEFVLLWHNHLLINPQELKLFKKFLSL